MWLYSIHNILIETVYLKFSELLFINKEPGESACLWMVEGIPWGTLREQLCTEGP